MAKQKQPHSNAKDCKSINHHLQNQQKTGVKAAIIDKIKLVFCVNKETVNIWIFIFSAVLIAFKLLRSAQMAGFGQFLLLGYESVEMHMEGRTTNELLIKINQGLLSNLTSKLNFKSFKTDQNSQYDLQKVTEVLEEEWNSNIGHRALTLEHSVNQNKYKYSINIDQQTDVESKSGTQNENDRLIENQHSQNEEDINNGIKHLYIELESFIITFKYFCNKAHVANDNQNIQAFILSSATRSFKVIEKKLLNWKRHFTFTKIYNNSADSIKTGDDKSLSYESSIRSGDALDRIIDVTVQAYVKAKTHAVKLRPKPSIVKQRNKEKPQNNEDLKSSKIEQPSSSYFYQGALCLYISIIGILLHLLKNSCIKYERILFNFIFSGFCLLSWMSFINQLSLICISEKWLLLVEIIDCLFLMMMYNINGLLSKRCKENKVLFLQSCIVIALFLNANICFFVHCCTTQYDSLNFVALRYTIIELIIILIALFLNYKKYPESIAPLKFEHYGNSKNLINLCIFISEFLHLELTEEITKN